MAANIKQSQADKFRYLADMYGLGKDDFFKAPQGFVIITRTGIEKIQRKLEVVVHYETVAEFSSPEANSYVVKAIGLIEYKILNEKTGKMEDKPKVVETFGEASPKNCRNAYPIAMAEKRALSRCVLKLADMYELGVYGEDEIDEK